jgi:hypothetical protein
MVKQPAVVEKPVVVEVKAAAVLDTSTLEATAKAAAASSTEQNLQDFTTVVAARRARMVHLPSPGLGRMHLTSWQPPTASHAGWARWLLHPPVMAWTGCALL